MSQKRKCSQGHTIPPTLEECPWCPKPSLGARPKTQVEPTIQMNDTNDSLPFSRAGGGRKGTMVVSPDSLPSGGGGLGAPVSTPRPVPQGGGGGIARGKRTIVVGPGQQGMGAPAPLPSSLPSSGSGTGVSVAGASPLAGFLVSFSMDANGVFWPLRMGRTRLGASPDSDIQLSHPGISGSHANITIRDNKGRIKIWLTDQDSMNGTRLNGESIFNEKPDLTHGDRIGIGDVEMQLILLPGR